ncbi:hypothetical protein H6802_02810 [Candidatus Nomurabacteria bacterium]|uniref:Trigger factor n=1 Tax=candidate division WWE3 bacterium TaxID=2053526 RepID=A0A955E258_UNCKA|nr:hypothetical protein [candidate division WWE3 bacterium]MCB9823865.1 hypothetical protein [Candidatus Nomurabacteria bacterium]MCB9827155.1 hypothetical protein [Candidatus Nomurabacteria bacterium]MCB9827804.1 hypothetical protein [Candidatus Nomurabacteria bacterium]HXK52613.1 trigger factor [bacterium]
MKTKITKEQKSTVKLQVTVPADKVKSTYNSIFEELVKNTELPGFRKGQAPKNLVEEKTDVSKLYGDVINELLKIYYPQALKEHLLQPIANPKVEVTEFDLDKDFEFTATVAIMPDVKVGDYIKALKKIHKENSEKIRAENAEKLKRGEAITGHDHAHLSPDEVVNSIVEVTTAEVADLVIEDEVDRMMTRLVDQAQAVGISLEQYLKSQNKTADQLREDYGVIALRNLKAEFALDHLLKKSKIEVSDAEVEEMVKATGDTETEALMQNPMQKMYVKSILAKNKLISNIIKEVEGDLHSEDNSQTKKNSGPSKAGKGKK